MNLQEYAKHLVTELGLNIYMDQNPDKPVIPNALGVFHYGIMAETLSIVERKMKGMWTAPQVPKFTIYDFQSSTTDPLLERNSSFEKSDRSRNQIVRNMNDLIFQVLERLENIDSQKMKL